jgi:predicted MFS family arabinose efflux permease
MAAKEATRSARRLPVLWRNRDYMLLWSGQIISATGSSASQIAFPLLVLFMTGSPAQAGLIGGMQALPYLFLSLPVGALVDRWNRKTVMIAADGVRALNMATVPLAFTLGHLSVVQLYLVALVEGSAFVFFNLAEVAALPKVVEQEQLPAASAQNQTMYMVATLAGPPLGGSLYQAAGKTIPFLADAVSYAVSVISLFFIRTRFQDDRTAEPRRLLVEIAEGLRWLWNHRMLRFTALIMGLTTLLTAGGFLLLIVLARGMHVSPAGIGLILSVASIGGIAGAIITPWLQRRLSFGQALLGTMWVQSVLIFPFAWAPNPALLTVSTTLLFITFPVAGIVIISYRLALIPDELQGRVNSVFRLALWAPAPASQALTGAGIQLIGARPAVAVMGIGMLILAAAATINPLIRHAPPIQPREQSQPAEASA